jgi:hypothetical protein
LSNAADSGGVRLALNVLNAVHARTSLDPGDVDRLDRLREITGDSTEFVEEFASRVIEESVGY